MCPSFAFFLVKEWGNLLGMSSSKRRNPAGRRANFIHRIFIAKTCVGEAVYFLRHPVKEILMFLWSASSIGKCVSFLGVLTVSVWLLTGTPTIGQSAKAPVTSTAPTKTTIQTAEKRLLALGYQCGAADGVMGAKAIAALKKFQADRRLPVTGQLDRKTLDALNAEGAKAPNVGVNKDVTTEGKYRDLQKRADGLECHLYATMALRNTGAGNTVSGGRSFECIDASKKSTEISLLATQNLPNEKVAIITKDFGTMYWRSDEVCV